MISAYTYAKEWRKNHPDYRKKANCVCCNKKITVGFKFCKSCSVKERIKLLGSPFKGKKHSAETKLLFSKLRKGKNKSNKNSNWKGGKKDDGQGYVLLYLPSHPNAINERYVYEHRWVIETHLGRYLRRDEHIHHINGDKKDNRLENLKLLSAQEHLKLHYKTNHALLNNPHNEIENEVKQ